MKKPKTRISVPSIKKSFNDRHPFVVPIVTLAGLLVATLIGFLIYGGQVVKPADSKVVTLYVDGKSRSIPTRAGTVGEMLKRAGVDYDKKDLIEPSVDTPITSSEFSVNIYRAKQVTIVDENGKKTITKIADTTPVVMATQAGYKLYPEDIVKIAEPDASLKEGIIGTEVVIDRATPIKMNLFGKTYDIRTHAVTVEDLVKERNLSFTAKSILPSLKTKLKPNDVVFVTDPGKQIASVEEEIPNGEETINDLGLPLGQKEIRTEGAPGKKVVVYQISSNGQRIPLQEIVISNPVDRVVVIGRKAASTNFSVAGDKAALMAQAGIPADQQGAADYIISRESGWRPGATSPNNCIGLGQKCNAASLIAACPNWQTDAICQLGVFNSYAVGRYGSWNEAYNFWIVNHWW